MSHEAFVLDNSVVMAWLLGEEDRDADVILDLFLDRQALVPGVWPLEFANATLVAERRKRITEAEAARAREIVRALPIEVVVETPDRVATAILSLAREHGLSVYDASYLDLALREGLPIATLDARLGDAAKATGVFRLYGS